MNQDQLVEILTSAGRTLHDPASTQTQRLQALKTQALPELESAHLFLYQQRAMQAIEVQLAAQEAEKESKNKSLNDENNLIQYFNFNFNEDNIVQEKYSTSNLSKLFGEPEKEDPKEAAKRNLAYVAARNAISQDQGIARFRGRIDRLEQSGDVRTLESLLRATHDVAVTAPLSAQEFVETLEQVPDRDLIEYAALVTHLFNDHTDGAHGSPLTSRLAMIMPEREPRIFNSWLEKESGSDPIYDSPRFEKITSLENIYSFKDNDLFLRERERHESFGLFKKPQENDLGISLGQVQKAMSVQSLGLSALLDASSVNSSFFSELQEVYRQLGKVIASEWLRTANTKFAEDWSQGRDFALLSRPSVQAYVHNLDWGLEQFVADYRVLGKDAFFLNAFAHKYRSVPKERVRSLIRDLVQEGDGATIISLVQNPLPEGHIGALPEKLSPEITNQEFIQAVRRTADLYDICKSHQVNAHLVRRELLNLPNHMTLSGYEQHLAEAKKRVTEYAEFVSEQRKHFDINLSFNDDLAQETLALYCNFLGKNFAQFKRDFQATGNVLQRLPKLKDMYKYHFGDDKLCSILNYVAKQHSRDLILDLLHDIDQGYTLGLVTERIAGFPKKDTVSVLVELNKTDQFLREVGTPGKLPERLRQLPEEVNFPTIMDAIVGVRRECYATVVGENVNVPKELEAMIDNVVIAYHKETGGIYRVNIQPALRLVASTYVQEGPARAFEAIRELEPNKKLRKKFIQQGINTDAYEAGIKRQYHVSTNGQELERIKERIKSEMGQIYDRVSQLEIEEEALKELQQGSLREQLEAVEKFLGQYEFTKENESLKPEIKGHIQTVRSINGRFKEAEDDVNFYVSTDPLEALHMGQYFNSCLSLVKNHGGVNAWAAVVQVMDSNKNVIYARGSDGKYLGRNRTALTDQGVLCTRFYQNGNLYLDEAWVDYLSQFADEVRQDVMVPTTFALSGMSKK